MPKSFGLWSVKIVTEGIFFSYGQYKFGYQRYCSASCHSRYDGRNAS